MSGPPIAIAIEALQDPQYWLENSESQLLRAAKHEMLHVWF